MKNVAIVTIYDDNNYGNRLQNFAVQEKLNSLSNIECITITNIEPLNNKSTGKDRIVQLAKTIYVLLRKKVSTNANRHKNFRKFDKNINHTKSYFRYDKYRKEKFDYYIVGSDQVWNPKLGRLKDFDLLTFVDENEKKIALSASFGINDIPGDKRADISKFVDMFKAISMREDRGREIVQTLTNRTDVETLIDPTMLLTATDWDKVSNKPKQLGEEKYILNYFLGKLSDERKKEIERIAKENNCKIINIMDPKDPFYTCGPSEFLYLEKNAFLICTDSFHSSVFAILYDRPFIVFDREQEGMANMNSRIDTLINKFNLKNRRFTGKITKENLEHDYSEAYKILEDEREKSDIFLKNALEVK